MPIIALLSDLHANALALEAVYAFASEYTDTYWILGDLLGYGPYPDRTLRLVQSIQPQILLTGNHDWYVMPADPADREGDGRLRGPTYRRDEWGELIRVAGPRESAWAVALRHRAVCSDDM